MFCSDECLTYPLPMIMSSGGDCTQDSTTQTEEDDGPAPEALSVDDLPNAAEIKAMPFERQWRKVGTLA